MTPEETAAVAEMARELQRKIDAMEVTFRPFTVLQLAGLVQLALRHPEVSPNHRAVAETFLAGVRAYFADCPTVLDVLRRGDDPRADLPWRP